MSLYGHHSYTDDFVSHQAHVRPGMWPEDRLPPLTGVWDVTTPRGLKTPQMSLRRLLELQDRARTGVRPSARGIRLYSQALPPRSNLTVSCTRDHFFPQPGLSGDPRPTPVLSEKAVRLGDPAATAP